MIPKCPRIDTVFVFNVNADTTQYQQKLNNREKKID